MLEDIRTAAKKRKRISMDMSEVEKLTPDGIAVFTAQISRLPTIQIYGNEPTDPESKEVFIRSGFLKRVTTQSRRMAPAEQGLILTQMNDVVEPVTADLLIKFPAKNLGMHTGQYKAAYRVLIECMSNTRQHAKGRLDPNHEDWWATVYCLQTSTRACFTFIDWGVGIVQSLKLKLRERLYRSWSPDMMLKEVLDGNIASRTGKLFRGKGLPGINKAAAEGLISNVVIITNRAYADVSGGKFRILSTPFRGTFVYWEVIHGEDK